MDARAHGASPTKAPRRAPRPGVTVPSWYDLPLLLPDTDPVVGRLQRENLETLRVHTEPQNGVRAVPKVSRLVPSPKHQTSHWRTDSGKRVFVRPRKTTHAGAAVVLDRLPISNQTTASRRRERLRDKLWSDLQRFGLWHFDRVGDDAVRWDEADENAAVRRDTAASVDATVESILSQLGPQEIEDPDDNNDKRGDVDETASDAVFLTAVPLGNGTEKTAPMPQSVMVSDKREETENDNDREEDEREEEEEEETQSLASRFRRDIQAPGLKRRQRLQDLHVFVEKQLQKRLYRSWETIEIALAGSGDLSVHQIVKFLQNSDVKLSAVDAAKVQSILHQHIEQQRVAKEKEQAEAATAAAESEAAVAAPTRSTNAKVSYAAFRKVFQPRDMTEAARWKREYDRDKVRLRQEKEVYDRELAALEEKVQKRLAESAKHMVDVLASFRCNPLAMPWTTDAQRLDLRRQLLHIIFSKPARRRLSLAGAAISASVAAVGGISSLGADESATPATVEGLETTNVSVPKVRSALLQKYSRNGHFDGVDVPVAAYVFHDIAADAIKTSIRALWHRRAADLWPERQRIFQWRLQKAVFLEWKRFTKHADVLRTHVLRKFVAWAFLTRQRLAYYVFYRTCFWPFYVWKRHLQHMIIARGKSSFLRRVVHTYIQLRNFRAWKKRYRRKAWGKKQVVRLRTKKAREVLQICWHEWLARLRVHLAIYRLWTSRGHVLQQLHKGYMVKVTFLLWRYYVILKHDQAARRFKCFHSQFPPVGSTTTAKPSPGKNNRPAVSPSRGVSWMAPSTTSSNLAGPRSASMAVVPRSKGGVSLDDGIDAFVEDDEETEDADVRMAQEDNVRTLSKIMETDLAPKIKRKTRLYDLCLHLYLRFRERDRRDMTGNIITFRRIGRVFLRALSVNVSVRKKNRMATDLGAFRHLHDHFRWWVAVALYKQPGRHNKENHHEEDEPTAIEKRALDWKRDTEWRLLGLANLSVEAAQLQNDVIAIATQNAKRLERVQDLEAQLRERRRAEEVFLRKEAGATLKVRALQMLQAQQILRTRGHRLHDVLDRTFDVLRAQERQYQLKSAFRGLRVAMMERYTTTLGHRAQLRNWLRLCRRFRFWNEHASRFYALRLKFRAFRTLLRHVVWKWKHESPGWSATLQSRQRLVRKYEQYLTDHNLLDGSPAAARLALTKYSPSNAFHGVFLRWVQYTQLTKTYRDIVAIVRRKRELWRVHSTFQTLKTHLKAKYTTDGRRAAVPFLWRQCVADLDAVHCKILALYARLPSQQLRRQLHMSQLALQHTATGAPTLKQRFQRHEHEIHHRLFLESRLLLAAYTERRVHHYAERQSGLVGAPVGRAFAYEQAPPYGSISEVVVVCSKQVDAVSLVLKTQSGASVEGALHGNAFGTREVFSLVRGEKLVAIEGFASQTIYALRLTTSTGRHSKWFGLVDKGTRFELKSDWSSAREEIVGVFGFADATSLHALGSVFRRTTERNIFEGLWLPPTVSTEAEADAEALCDRQFAYFMQVRRCDVLLAMQRAHALARRLHRLAPMLPSALVRPRVVLSLMRWFLNSLTHGLVHASEHEDQGRKLLEDGKALRTRGEKSVDDGMRLVAEVDSFRDSDKQLQVAVLGTKKIAELHEMLAQGDAKITKGHELMDEGDELMTAGQRLLPHLPMTARMMKAIRRMYKVVQTKDYIDQMDPELRATLLAGDANSTPTSIYDDR